MHGDFIYTLVVVSRFQPATSQEQSTNAQLWTSNYITWKKNSLFNVTQQRKKAGRRHIHKNAPPNEFDLKHETLFWTKETVATNI